MRVVHRLLRPEKLDAAALQPLLQDAPQLVPQLVLIFAPVAFFSSDALDQLLTQLPRALCIGCSTAGEVGAHGVSEGPISLTAIRFEHATLQVVEENLFDMMESRSTGERLAAKLAREGLRGVFMLAPGVGINGSALIEGVAHVLGAEVPISGGLAADHGRFESTFVLGPSGAGARRVVAVGFYGEGLELRHGSYGGWQPFGPVRRVTGADGNVLLALDGARALDVYRRYLGEHAAGLPGTALLFPLSVLDEGQRATGIVRTILGVDEERGALILAGDIQLGGHVQLMHASKDALIDGATRAATHVHEGAVSNEPSLAILISCVGRKLVMGARVDEEVEAVADVLGPSAVLTGFYSNGEMGPLHTGLACKLHNQTMTVTLLRESLAPQHAGPIG